jgi:hypothetical protein
MALLMCRMIVIPSISFVFQVDSSCKFIIMRVYRRHLVRSMATSYEIWNTAVNYVASADLLMLVPRKAYEDERLVPSLLLLLLLLIIMPWTTAINYYDYFYANTVHQMTSPKTCFRSRASCTFQNCEQVASHTGHSTLSSKFYTDAPDFWGPDSLLLEQAISIHWSWEVMFLARRWQISRNKQRLRGQKGNLSEKSRRKRRKGLPENLHRRYWGN